MKKFLKSRQEGSVWWNEGGDQQENCTKKTPKNRLFHSKDQMFVGSSGSHTSGLMNVVAEGNSS